MEVGAKKLGNISTYFINHLSTESRLQAANPANTFDAVNDFPVEPLHKLYIDDKKKKNYRLFFHQAFRTEFIVNRGAGSQIPIHVGMTPTMDEGEDRVSMSYLSKLKNYHKFRIKVMACEVLLEFYWTHLYRIIVSH